MVQVDSFKEWLKDNTEYSDAVIGDTASRMKRADSILEWNDTDVVGYCVSRNFKYYLFLFGRK